MTSLLFISGIGPTETLVILAVALLVFGGRLPEVAKSLGRSLNELRRGMRDLSSEIERDVYEPIRREVPRIDVSLGETLGSTTDRREVTSTVDDSDENGSGATEDVQAPPSEAVSDEESNSASAGESPVTEPQTSDEDQSEPKS